MHVVEQAAQTHVWTAADMLEQTLKRRTGSHCDHDQGMYFI